MPILVWTLMLLQLHRSHLQGAITVSVPTRAETKVFIVNKNSRSQQSVPAGSDSGWSNRRLLASNAGMIVPW